MDGPGWGSGVSYARTPWPVSQTEDAVDPDRCALESGAAALGVELAPAKAGTLLAYLDAMLEENRKVNLTSIRARPDGVVRHLLDSLSVAAAWSALAGDEPPRRYLDVGTGGGFPGAPLAVYWPGSRGVLVDGTGKKVRAVQRCLQAAGIGNAEAVQARAEQLHALDPSRAHGFDLCVGRAVGPSARLIESVFRLVAPGGRVFLMKGPGLTDREVGEAERVAARRRLQPEPPFTALVPGLDARTILSFVAR